MKTQLFITLCLVVACTAQQQFAGDVYQGQTASLKSSQLWQQIAADQTPYGWFSILTDATIFLEDVSVSFSWVSDILPDGRKKLIHSVGCVAQAEFVADQNPYTGVFQGADNMLVRISSAKQYDSTKPPLGNFVPGMGIKLLRDGVASANLVAMYSVDGQDSWNPFKNSWSNHIPDATTLAAKAIAKKFAEATPYTGAMGTKPWAKYDQSGNEVSDSELNIPFQLIFSPSADVNNLFPDTFTADLIDQLPTISVGVDLFDVLAVDQPNDTPVKIGTIKTTSQFVQSNFGDKTLFFEHNDFADDVALHPDWQNYVKKDSPLF